MQTLEGKTLALPGTGGRFDVVVIRNVEYLASVGSKEEADRIIKIVNGATSAVTKTPAPKAAPAPASTHTRKKVLPKKKARKAMARKATSAHKTPGNRKTAGSGGRAHAGAPAKETVDMGELSRMVEVAGS